jgi:hypothetical protein
LDAAHRCVRSEDVRHRLQNQQPIDDKDYQAPFAFTGKIDKLTISIEPPVLTDADNKKLNLYRGPGREVEGREAFCVTASAAMKFKTFHGR